MELEGAHVLVTGASRGIGAELARRFAAAGATVTASARSEEPLLALADESEGVGALAADLGDADTRAWFLQRVEAASGPVDVLVNNAGTHATGDFAALAAEDLARVIELNLLVPLELTRQAVPGMIERGCGHIDNLSSIAGVASIPGIVPYSATKAGLTHATAALRADLRGTPIRTTVVEVAFVETDMREGFLDYAPTRRAYDRLQRLRQMPDTPMDRICAATVDAVAAGREHVRFPGRMRGMMLLTEAPRRLTEMTLTGVRARP